MNRGTLQEKKSINYADAKESNEDYTKIYRSKEKFQKLK
jgi:hypothetical protein